MQSLSSGIYSVFSILFCVVAIVLRFSALLLNSSSGLIIAFYIFALATVIFVVLRTIKEEGYSNAFKLNKAYRLDALSYFACFGFFVDFVHQCVRIFLSVQNGDYRSFATMSPIILSCIFALLSCFYFITVAMSYSDIGYDFRRLKLLHISPMLWAFANVLNGFTEPVSLLKEVDSIVKYFALCLAVAYFFCFAKEIENASSAKKSFVLFSRMFGYSSLIFFADRVMLIITGNAELLDKNSILAVCLLLISLFAVFQQRSINSIEGV